MSQIAQQGPQIARQGHRYLCNGKDVLALETGRMVKILYFNVERPWLCSTGYAQADKLVPQPMVYFADQVPQ
jgi:hypothetical protein